MTNEKWLKEWLAAGQELQTAVLDHDRASAALMHAKQRSIAAQTEVDRLIEQLKEVNRE